MPSSSSRVLRTLRVPLALLVLAGASACVPRGSTPEPGATGATGATASAPARASRGNHLVIGLEQEPDKLNSALNAMVYGTYINNAIYGYFVRFDQDMNVVPELVTEVPTLENGGISADYLTYTYHLRPGLTWHDGTPFTAEDVKFSVDVIMDTRHEIESRDGYDRITAIETPDPQTLVVRLREPYAPFADEFFFSYGVMPKHLLEGAVGTEFGQAPFHRAPVGLGPYRFQEWVTGSHVTIVPYEGYWRGKPAIDSITFRFIPDTNSLLVALQAGEIDGYDNAGTDQRDSIAKIPGVKEHVTPQLMWEHVDFQTEDPILSDVRVRQAVQLGIDRRTISEQVYAGLWPPAHGDVSPRLSWYNPKVEGIVRHDPDEARRLLDAAGWKPGSDGIRAKDGQRLTLSFSTTAGRRQRELVQQVIQQQLRDVGIEITIQNHNPTAFFAPWEQNGVLKRGKFQLALYAWITTPDPNKRSLYHSSQIPPPDGQNQPRFRNQRADEILDQGLGVVEVEKRKPMYDELQEILATQVPMTPIVWRSDIDPMTTRLENFKPNPTQNGDTWNIWEWRLADR